MEHKSRGKSVKKIRKSVNKGVTEVEHVNRNFQQQVASQENNFFLFVAAVKKT